VTGIIAPGSRLGPYEVLSAVGTGGMGEVYRAHDPRLDRVVAIKVVAPGLAKDPEQSHRFQREARAIAALNHPHICQIYDVGPNFLVLEYIDGAPATGPMPPETAMRLGMQIASAIDAAHRRGILHRDLKPANVLVTPEGAAKVLDFGLAKLTAGNADETQTTVGIAVGTTAYMSPEQAQSSQVDARTDIFSFGALLYEMLSGRRAFTGDSAAKIVAAVLRDEPAPLVTTPELDRIVRRCLAKLPEQRFQTMREVHAALEAAGGTSLEAPPSIAVLPFANLSGDKENEYFSDGLAEETINALTQIPQLKVTARTSAFAFRGKEVDIRRIGEALGVRTILEGSVRRAGNRVRITAQLINAADGYHLWSERFDREMTDVFVMQDDIAAAIARALEVKLSPAPVRRPTQSPEAYEHYLKAQYYSQKWTAASMANARDHFEQAIALDPEFALAHSMFAHYFVMLADSNFMPAHTAMPLARHQAQRALALDPSQPEAHAILGMVAGVYDYDWQEAERQFQIASARDPVPPFVRAYYVHRCFLPLGRATEGLEQVARGVKEDPLNVVSRTIFAFALRAAGRIEECNDQLRQVLQLDEQLWFPNFGLAISASLDHEYESALAFAEKAHALAPSVGAAVGLLAAVTARLGDASRSEALVNSLLPGDASGAPLGLAVFHLLTDRIDDAALWTEKAIEQRQPAVLLFLTVHARKLRQSTHWPTIERLLRLRRS
jgi:serine/threonine-protein kinase